MRRRILVLAVMLYVTADYCDPLLPGVFSFENTGSFFVLSTEARPAMPVLGYPAIREVLPAREVLEPIGPHMLLPAPSRARLDRYSPRSFVAVSPPPAPESSDDH